LVRLDKKERVVTRLQSEVFFLDKINSFEPGRDKSAYRYWKMINAEKGSILVITGTRAKAQSFGREVGIGSSSLCLLGREFRGMTLLIRGGKKN